MAQHKTARRITAIGVNIAEIEYKLDYCFGLYRPRGGGIYDREVMEMGFMIVFFVVNAFLGVLSVSFGIEPMALYGKAKRQAVEAKPMIADESEPERSFGLFPWR